MGRGRVERRLMIRVAAWWISASVVRRPKLKRMEASDWAGVRPSARRTCEGSGHSNH